MHVCKVDSWILDRTRTHSVSLVVSYFLFSFPDLRNTKSELNVKVSCISNAKPVKNFCTNAPLSLHLFRHIYEYERRTFFRGAAVQTL